MPIDLPPNPNSALPEAAESHNFRVRKAALRTGPQGEAVRASGLGPAQASSTSIRHPGGARVGRRAQQLLRIERSNHEVADVALAGDR
eukprot:378547-Alexandrium_andersonii.AAC.1